ncbi:MAG: response regulator [Desulfobacterota bacterium]|nr:response regulator [Thermodesulfobacteriota bacterium]
MDTDHFRILIVDDERPIQELLLNFLSSTGHECETADNGREALVRLGQRRFDAVVTDVVMPEMNGIELTQEISKRFPDLPVMVMTGFSDEYSAQKAIAAGAREFIKKPFTLSEFSIRLNKMIRDQEILRRIEVKKSEIEEISRQMISGLQAESRERIDALQREIEELRKKLG